MPKPGRELELRCFCGARPLLGVCGRDTATRQPYVWVKVFKQGRVYGEIVATSGDVHIRCRECRRWHIVSIQRVGVDFKPQPLPETIAI